MDRINKSIIDTNQYKAKIRVVDGVRNNAVDFLGNENSIIITNALRQIKDEVTISFFFKGRKFTFQTLPKPEFFIQFEYPYFVFNTTSLNNGKRISDNWKIDLKGAGIESYDYFTDNNWHQLTFTVSLKSGIKQVFVDGQSSSIYNREIQKGGTLLLSGADGFKQTDLIDELSFYNISLNKNFALKEFEKIAGSSLERSEKKVVKEKKVKNVNGLDILDFAPGYPDYTLHAIDQLKEFPDPRYSPVKQMPRNFPWMDITYLHRELPGIGGKGFGKVNPARAIELSMELYDKWNYYFEIPVIRNDLSELNRIYSSTKTIPGALINYARRNPDLKTSSTIFQVQGKPIHAGLDLTSSFVVSQNLPITYYLKDNSGKPIKTNGRFWLSPLAPLDIIYKDAKTTSFYLSNVQKHLGRPIDMLNENGEYFGHIRTKNLLESDPDVKRDLEKRNLSIHDYNGWFQNKLDTAYKNEILRNLNWKKTSFTFYNVAAIQPEYWPSYSYRRTSNEVVNKNHYSTPDFYPATPGNWQLGSGQYNGYGIIADGRKREIALGDKLFAPFVSAGWSFEENNIRPAQWLGLMKSMMMLGAEYYHVGYFNITGRSGWPDGKGPFDPRGYIYQAAIPAYVQALSSRVYRFFESGTLLNPQENLQSKIYSFRFKGLKENHLIMVRKLGDEYLIYGSIQPVSNKAGQVSNEENTRIDLEGDLLEFKIRRQGSVYLLNKRKNTFIQIDGWHQHEHPIFWSKDYKIEAELADEFGKGTNIKTNGVKKSGSDYSDFQTTLSIPEGSGFSMFIDKSRPFNGLSLFIKNIQKRSSSIKISLGENSITKKIDSDSFSIVRLTREEMEKLISTNSNKLQISTFEGNVEVDYVILNN